MTVSVFSSIQVSTRITPPPFVTCRWSMSFTGFTGVNSYTTPERCQRPKILYFVGKYVLLLIGITFELTGKARRNPPVRNKKTPPPGLVLLSDQLGWGHTEQPREGSISIFSYGGNQNNAAHNCCFGFQRQPHRATATRCAARRKPHRERANQQPLPEHPA